MTVEKIDHIAIIGAGIAGLTLAVALKQQGINCTVFEARPEGPLPFSGPLTLTPNGLRIAEALGFYERLRACGSDSRYATSVSMDNRIIGMREIGNVEKYGYDALRIYRHSTITTLLHAVQDHGIPIRYGQKFVEVVAESSSSITAAFADGHREAFDFLVGTDGLHSKVRKYLLPEISPTYTGNIAVAALAPTSHVRLPSNDISLPFSVSGKAGHMILCPNGPEDPVCPVATGVRFEELNRQGWERLGADKDQLRGILRQNYDQWSTVVQSALDAVDDQTLMMWPFYFVSPLSTWRSSRGRVIIMGDAAHALPPIGALGANLALEDAFSFGMLLGGINRGEVSLNVGISWWQQYRMDRLEKVTSLTDTLTRKRQQGSAKDPAEPQVTYEDAWVFEMDVKKDVNGFLLNTQ